MFQLHQEQRAALGRTDLRQFADFLDARIEGSQYTFWRRYAFRELPVELISHLYEQFLPKQPGVVYTPPFLVNFILDEVLPLSERTPERFKLLDPACGSGVFLVGAFKRLVHRWRRDNDFRRPDVATLKSLLSNHLFGVDVEPEAVRLTLFSLSVALCDFLDPRVIWEDLHFDALEGANLQTTDFFAYARDGLAASSFDVVVGNPPFVSALSVASQRALADIVAQEPGFVLPDNQVALLFLKEATRVAKPGAEIALIQPSVPLLYGEKSDRFRSPFLERVHVSQIVDLTHLSRVLFKRSPIPAVASESQHNSRNPGDVAVAIVFATNHTPRDRDLLHVTVRRTVQAEQKMMLEIDHYDLHLVSRSDAVADSRVWKANFIGGGRVLHFLRRLGRLPTLRTYLNEMKAKRGWDFGEGYIAGSEQKVERLSSLSKKQKTGLTAAEESELNLLRKRHRPAPWLTKKRTMPTEAFTAKGIDWSQVETIEQRWFTEPRRASLFRVPLLLIKLLVEEKSNKVPVAFGRPDIRFKDRIYGIHAPKKDMARLRRIQEAVADQRMAHFYVLSTSSEYLISRSSAFQSVDLLNLPFVASGTALSLSPVEDALVDDALAYVAEFRRKGDRAAILGAPTEGELRAFGEFFCRALGTMYSKLKAGQPRRFAGAICYPFYFGHQPSLKLEEGGAGLTQLDALMSTTVGTSLRCQRILRIFHGNMLFLIKPVQRRYWLRSIALRDADDIFVELRERGF